MGGRISAAVPRNTKGAPAREGRTSGRGGRAYGVVSRRLRLVISLTVAVNILQEAREAPAGLGPGSVSIVIPCLNEAESIGQCVNAAQRVLDEHGLDGEVLVVDNGSDDGSGVLARLAGARVV